MMTALWIRLFSDLYVSLYYGYGLTLADNIGGRFLIPSRKVTRCAVFFTPLGPSAGRRQSGPEDYLNIPVPTSSTKVLGPEDYLF
jgi:hypothetical protein